MNRKGHCSRCGLALCSVLLFAFGLSACSFGGSSGNATPTPTSMPRPTPSPTPSVTLKTYKGDGFTIGYPASWTVKASASTNGAGGVAFQNASGMTEFLLEILPNSDGVIAPEGVVKRGLSVALQTAGGKNAKTVSIAPTTAVGGETWNQAAITGSHTQNGQTVALEIVMMATNHPAASPNTRLFIITYVGPAQVFDKTNATAFQPMLQSFKFTN